MTMRKTTIEKSIEQRMKEFLDKKIKPKTVIINDNGIET